MRRTRLVEPLASVVLFALAGCSEAGETDADCAQQVRLDGVVYTGWSATKASAQPLGDAERASCDDTSRNASGAYFPDDADSVKVWSFDGYPPDEVLGVRLNRESYTIFVAETLSDAARDRVVRELRKTDS
jgi:hypothetical protein